VDGFVVFPRIARFAERLNVFDMMATTLRQRNDVVGREFYTLPASTAPPLVRAAQCGPFMRSEVSFSAALPGAIRPSKRLALRLVAYFALLIPFMHFLLVLFSVGAECLIAMRLILPVPSQMTEATPLPLSANIATVPGLLLAIYALGVFAVILASPMKVVGPMFLHPLATVKPRIRAQFLSFGPSQVTRILSIVGTNVLTMCGYPLALIRQSFNWITGWHLIYCIGGYTKCPS
jgi:hypothetical protein